jgi:hypothetical protein
VARNLLTDRFLQFINQGVSNEARYTKRFYPDRVDDRRGDYRYFGRGGFACLPRLHGTGQNVGSDFGCVCMSHINNGIFPGWQLFANGS